MSSYITCQKPALVPGVWSVHSTCTDLRIIWQCTLLSISDQLFHRILPPKGKLKLRLCRVIKWFSPDEVAGWWEFYSCVSQSEARLSPKDHIRPGGQYFVHRVSVSPYEYLPAGRGIPKFKSRPLRKDGRCWRSSSAPFHF